MAGGGNWLGWNFGNRGASNKAGGQYTEAEIVILGKVGDVENFEGNQTAIHRAEIVIRDKKSGKTLAQHNTLGSLRELLEQARSIQAKGEEFVGNKERAERSGTSEGGTKSSGRGDRQAGRSTDPDPSAPDSWS